MSGVDRAEEGRLDRPPAASARARLPDGFGCHFLIFGDAEEEFDWTRPRRRDATATTAMLALPEANRRLVAAGCRPTYLVDYPVVANAGSAAAVAAMIADDACDIGSQLHPWVTPPHDEEVTTPNSFTGNLPPALEAAKVAALTAKIAEVTGAAPVIYRAGRYGIGPNSAAILARHGYRLDVSVRSLFDYRDEAGPDFSHHPVWPWWPRPDLLELPLTSAYIGPLRRFPGLHRNPVARRWIARGGLLSRVALTPEGMPLADAQEAVRVLLGEGTQLFSLSFHTPSVVPGHTPYVRDAADLAAFWRWWDAIFDQFAKAGVTALRAPALIDAAFGRG